MQFLHGLVGNWGVAIILITLIVRGGMYPLSKAQYTSMAKMRLLQPKLTALRERLGDDRQKMSQAMMELYKEEKVNPLGGCFPLLVQMPIFIALYWTLMESVELRHAPFALWLTDLSVKRSILRIAAADGCHHVVYPEDEPNHSDRPNAAESDAIHADHLHFHVPVVPIWSDFVLGSQ